MHRITLSRVTFETKNQPFATRGHSGIVLKERFQNQLNINKHGLITFLGENSFHIDPAVQQV